MADIVSYFASHAIHAMAINADGGLVACTPCDIVFLLLPLLETSRGKVSHETCLSGETLPTCLGRVIAQICCQRTSRHHPSATDMLFAIVALAVTLLFPELTLNN